jgi:hypothetical protein
LALAINDHCSVISNIMQLCFHEALLLVSVRMFIEPSYADYCWVSALVVLLWDTEVDNIWIAWLAGWVQKVILPEVWTDDTVVRDLCCHLSDLTVSASPPEGIGCYFLVHFHDSLNWSFYETCSLIRSILSCMIM